MISVNSSLNSSSSLIETNSAHALITIAAFGLGVLNPCFCRLRMVFTKKSFISSGILARRSTIADCFDSANRLVGFLAFGLFGFRAFGLFGFRAFWLSGLGSGGVARSFVADLLVAPPLPCFRGVVASGLSSTGVSENRATRLLSFSPLLVLVGVFVILDGG